MNKREKEEWKEENKQQYPLMTQVEDEMGWNQCSLHPGLHHILWLHISILGSLYAEPSFLNI